MSEPENYTEEVQTLGIHGYTSTPEEDILILNWHSKIVTSKELSKVFSTSCYSISQFFRLFQRPNWLFYTTNEEGIDLAIWAEPMLATACIGLWIAPKSRESFAIKPVFRSMQLIYYMLFTMFNSIIGITKQEKLLAIHTRLGYTTIGKMENFLDNEPCWLVHLTREAFENGKLHPKRR